MKPVVKSVNKSVENEWIWNKWRSTPYSILGIWHTTCVFLFWCVQAWVHGTGSPAFPIQTWYNIINNHSNMKSSVNKYVFI